MSDQLHARVDMAWSRAWVGFAAVTVLGLGVAAWQVLGVGPTRPPRPPVSADAAAPIDDAGPLEPCASQGACEQRCGPTGAGEQAACLRLAAMLRAGTEGRAPDHRAARDVDRRTCRATRAAQACGRATLIDALLADLSAVPEWLDHGDGAVGALYRACNGVDDNDDDLACAAINLLSPHRISATELEPSVRSALAACEEGNPEACHLAATPGTAGAAAGMKALRTFCDRGDLPSCLYQWRQSGGDPAGIDALLRACPDVEGQPRLAIACHARAATGPRKRELSAWACAAGYCPGIDDPEVLTASCAAGHLNGCAEALTVLRPAGMELPAWKDAWARASRLAPEVLSVAPPVVPPAAEGYVDACYFGSVRGCDRALAVWPADNMGAVAIRRQTQRLREPLVNP